MALTVNQAFIEFQRKSEPRSIADGDVAAKHAYLRQVLNNKIDLVDDFLIGSYVKNTQIKPRTDIDVFFVLNSSYWTDDKLDTPRKVFMLLLRNLRTTYPASKIRSDGQAVTIQQSNGFKIDVIPAYSFNSNTYIIPNQHGQTWIQCNPLIHIGYLTDWNKQINGKLKPLIKMVKCWAKVNEVPIKSFHLELLVVEAFKMLTSNALNEVSSSLSRATTHIFQQGCTLIDKPFYDEVGERVDLYLDKGNLRTMIWKKFQIATEHSTRAWHLENKGKHMAANSSWRKLFKFYFPKGSS